MISKRFLLAHAICFLLCPLALPQATADSGYDKYWDKAIELQRNKQYEAADRVFSVGIAKYPTSSKLYFWRAKLRGNYLGEIRGAIQDYTSVIALQKSLAPPKAYYMRGNMYSKIGAYQQALSDLNTCLRMNPKYGDRAYIDRAGIYAKLNMIKEAKRDIDYLIRKKSKYSKNASKLWIEISQGRRTY